MPAAKVAGRQITTSTQGTLNVSPREGTSVPRPRLEARPEVRQQGDSWKYIEDPLDHVIRTQGDINHGVEGTTRTEEQVKELDRALSKERSEQVKRKVPTGGNQWSSYPQTELDSLKSAEGEGKGQHG